MEMDLLVRTAGGAPSVVDRVVSCFLSAHSGDFKYFRCSSVARHGRVPGH